MDKLKKDNKNIDSDKPEDSTLFITVFVDGSYCPKTKAWGIGVWIKDSQKKSQTYSTGGTSVENSSQVELYGLQFVEILLINLYDVKNKIIVIQCDNISVLEKYTFPKLIHQCIKYIKKKHVKAHSNNNTKRTMINHKVDVIAKKEMKKYRKMILKLH